MKKVVALIVIFGMFAILGVSTSFAGLSDGLVAYYPFNGNAIDESGNGNNGTVHGATLTQDRFGNVNSAYSFDGVNNYIQIFYNSALNVNPTGFTATLWIKANPNQFSSDTHFNLIDKSHGSGANGWTIQGCTAWDSLGFAFGNGSNFDSGAGISASRVLDDQWHYIVGVFDSVTCRFYLDGTLQSSIDVTGNPAPNAGDLYIGKWFLGNSRHFHGIIDDLHIYNRALSESEIQELYSGTPDLIKLDQFNAVTQGNQIAITWNTLSELDNAGFNLWRSESKTGKYSKINSKIIEAKGGATQKADYSYIDNTAKTGITYNYKLEDIDTRGVSTFHEPISATIPLSRPNYYYPPYWVEWYPSWHPVWPPVYDMNYSLNMPL